MLILYTFPAYFNETYPNRLVAFYLFSLPLSMYREMRLFNYYTQCVYLSKVHSIHLFTQTIKAHQVRTAKMNYISLLSKNKTRLELYACTQTIHILEKLSYFFL